MGGGSIAFYETSAQVIPVLVLVLIVEQREVSRRHERDTQLPPLANLVYRFVAIFAAVVGEVVALQDVYLGKAPATDEYWVVTPLAVLAAALIVPVGVAALRDVEVEGEGWKSTTARVVTGIVLAGFLLVGLAVARR